MANVINNVKDGPGIFAKGIAETLRDNMALCGFVDKADQSDFDGKNGFKSGDTIYTSIPPRYPVQEDDLDITTTGLEDTVEEKKPLVLNKTATIGMKLDSLELATDIDVARALERHGIPAAESIAQNIEARCFGIVKNSTYNSVGSPGSNAFGVADILAARTKLNQNLCRPGNRALFMTSASGAAAVDARKGLFQDSSNIAGQYRDGMIGRADGFDWYETELISTHTNGSDVTGAETDGTTAEGASALTVTGLSSAPAEGTVFTLDGVFMVHPILKETTNVLQQFVVGPGATTTNIPVTPSLYAASGGLQNISALPANDTALTFVGAASTGYEQNIALHKSSFKMVTAPLYAPKGVDLVSTQTVDGITVNLVRDFDIKTREVITRLDVLYAFDPVRPEWSVRITA